MTERLFRDGEGAALERVAELEDENRRLRAEIERLRSGDLSARRQRGLQPTAAGLGAVIGVGIGLVLLVGLSAGCP